MAEVDRTAMIRYYALLIVTWDFLMDGLSDHETLALLGVAYLLLRR